MSTFLYISLSGENKVACFEMDSDTGDLERKFDVVTGKGPAPLCVDPLLNTFYSGNRGVPEIASYRIDPATAQLTHLGAVPLEADPCYLATDKTGRYLLSAYYGAGRAAVHPIGEDGAATRPPVEWRATLPKAHLMETDASNRFAFVPHVGESNAIFQFHFDAETGRLTPNAVPKVAGRPGQGPRHLVFHPTLDTVYGDNEQESSVTAYRFDRESGRLEPFQTLSTLPEDFTGENSNAQIRIHPSGRFVYATNRGHDSIACFAIDSRSGGIASLGQQSTDGVPRAFNLDASGDFLFAAGLDTGRLASYRISEDGTLDPCGVIEVGQSPMWVLPVQM